MIWSTSWPSEQWLRIPKFNRSQSTGYNSVLGIVRRKFFFERIIFNSVVVVFFPLFLFLNLPMTRRDKVCRVLGALYIKCVGCHRGWKVETAGSNSAVDHNFCICLDTRYIVPTLYKQKTGFFRQILRFSDNSAFFLKNHPRCDVTGEKSFFLKTFQKNAKFFSDFSRKQKIFKSL